jgi:hypothetical protein
MQVASGENGHGRMVELASGIDALYCSGRADLPAEFLKLLDGAKDEAQTTGVEAEIVLGGFTFRVQGYGMGRYPYRLDHEHGIIAVTDSEKLPAVKIQPRASFLHGVGARVAIDWFRTILEGEVGSVQLTCSRLDLHSDWQGWRLDGDDRSRFVCRAATRVLYEDGGSFTGFVFGKRKTGTIAARIYDKTAEVQAKGNAYWEEIWGASRTEDMPVLRVEFEFGRQGLSEYGINSPYEAIEAASGLWVVATEWLSFRTPGDDATKARWPIAPEWQAVRRSTLAEAPCGLKRVYEGIERGNAKRIVPNLVGYLVSYAAIFGFDSAEEACTELIEVTNGFCASRGLSFDKRRRARRRKFGLP